MAWTVLPDQSATSTTALTMARSFSPTSHQATYTVRETQAASDDYKPVPDQPVTIVAGVDTELPVVNEFKPGSILITKLADTGDEPLTGACFGLDRGDGIEYEVCDQQAGDSDLREGIIQIRNVPPGEYTLVETVAPIGFDPGLDTQVTVEPNTEVELSIEISLQFRRRKRAT